MTYTSSSGITNTIIEILTRCMHAPFLNAFYPFHLLLPTRYSWVTFSVKAATYSPTVGLDWLGPRSLCELTTPSFVPPISLFRSILRSCFVPLDRPGSDVEDPGRAVGVGRGRILVFLPPPLKISLLQNEHTQFFQLSNEFRTLSCSPLVDVIHFINCFLRM